MMVELPDLPAPLSDMSREQIVRHIGLLIRASEKRERVEYGKPQFRPPWWPRNLLWENVRYDFRLGTDGPQGTWVRVLHDLVRKCYTYHNSLDQLLQPKCHSHSCKMGGSSGDAKTEQRVGHEHKTTDPPFSSYSEPIQTSKKAPTKMDFMSSFGLGPKRTSRDTAPPVFHSQSSSSCPQSPQTPRPFISQLSREFSPHRYRYEHGHVVSLEEDPDSDSKSVLNVEFSSLLGRQLLPVMEKQAPRIPRSSAEGVKELCHTPKKSDMTLKLRHHTEYSYPVTYRRSRKSANAHCHSYKFTQRQKREWWITIHTGLNRKTRALRAKMLPCRIYLKDMSEDEIRQARDKVRKEHLRKLEEQARQQAQWLQQQQRIQQQQRAQPPRPAAPYPVFLQQNSWLANLLKGGLVAPSGVRVQQGQALALTPPTTPERTSPTHGVNEADPIVIDDDDDVVCLSPKLKTAVYPQPPKPAYKPAPAAKPQEALLFKCHLCHNEISCRGDFCQRVEDHYADAHGLFHIKLVRHQDASGQMVVSIVEKDPQQAAATAAVKLPPANNYRARNAEPAPPKRKFITRDNPTRKILNKPGSQNRDASPEVICLD